METKGLKKMRQYSSHCSIFFGRNTSFGSILVLYWVIPIHFSSVYREPNDQGNDNNNKIRRKQGNGGLTDVGVPPMGFNLMMEEWQREYLEDLNNWWMMGIGGLGRGDNGKGHRSSLQTESEGKKVKDNSTCI